MSGQDFFLSVLGSSATKRDARAYLQRFNPPEADLKADKDTGKTVDAKAADHSAFLNGVNLGGFYGPSRAVLDSPKFEHQPHTDASFGPLSSAPLHVALVKLRAPQHLDNDTLHGVARTLVQLNKLGLTSTVVLDCDDYSQDNVDSHKFDWRGLAEKQADRVVTAIEAYGQPGARKMDNIIGVSESPTQGSQPSEYGRGRIHVEFRKLLTTPLKRSVIPVIPSIGYADKTQRAVPVKADDVALALTREFAGLQTTPLPDEGFEETAQRLRAFREEISLDRLIILDPLGGIPASDRPNGYHVFLNMEQEFLHVKENLLTLPETLHLADEKSDETKPRRLSDFGESNPFTKFLETEVLPESNASKTSLTASLEKLTSTNLIHLQNLELVRKVLSLLPPNSSALITTTEEAANSGKTSNTLSPGTGVGTRRLRNPLIHNLLTDKPAFSSSLPAGRLGHTTENDTSTKESISPTTFAKRGMSVSIFPDPASHAWEPPVLGKPRLSLTDSRIDLPRLVHLIEDSFNRKLDVREYLKRVNDRIAGVIIAGEYEGGALLTWEMPPGVNDDGSPLSRARMVPYLDKFAVLKRSQGAGGVADILFSTMVRDCFPEGVCWRSRRDNPVNKWYFERSRGTWKLPGSNWTMFWTTPDLDSKQQTFSDYEAVCRSIEPSWADQKHIVE